MMKLVGLVGWRGMVGSVLMQRMQEKSTAIETKLMYRTLTRFCARTMPP